MGIQQQQQRSSFIDLAKKDLWDQKYEYGIDFVHLKILTDEHFDKWNSHAREINYSTNP